MAAVLYGTLLTARVVASICVFYRRVSIPEAFITADIILTTLQNIAEGLVVYEKVIAANLQRELPFMATEYIIAAMVEQKRSRQDAHEELRRIAHEAAARVKQHGGENNYVALIRANKFFEPIHEQLDDLLDANNFVGGASSQVRAPSHIAYSNIHTCKVTFAVPRISWWPIFQTAPNGRSIFRGGHTA